MGSSGSGISIGPCGLVGAIPEPAFTCSVNGTTWKTSYHSIKNSTAYVLELYSFCFWPDKSRLKKGW